MAMFSFGLSELIDPDYEDMKNKLNSLKAINIELDWNNNRLDAFLNAVVYVLNSRGLKPTRYVWNRTASSSPEYDDITFTVICDGHPLNASLPLGVFFHPDCPRTLHVDVAEGMLAKYKHVTKGK